MAIKSYRDLEVWKQSMDVAVDCYRVTKQFPKEELYGMTSQIRRCAASIPANVAEGHGRQHTKEYIHFLSLANGSLHELETHLILCERVNLAKANDVQQLLKATDAISRMIAALRRSLQDRLK